MIIFCLAGMIEEHNDGLGEGIEEANRIVCLSKPIHRILAAAKEVRCRLSREQEFVEPVAERTNAIETRFKQLADAVREQN